MPNKEIDLPQLKDGKTDFTKIINIMLRYGNKHDKKIARETRQGVYDCPFRDPLIRKQTEEWYISFMSEKEK